MICIRDMYGDPQRMQGISPLNFDDETWAYDNMDEVGPAIHS